MLPVSYRANSTFYPQRTSFIEFEDSAVVELMTPSRVGELVKKLAAIHNIPFSEPSDDEVRQAVEADTTHAADWEDYQSFLDMARRADESNRPERARSYRDNAHELREGWFAAGAVDRGKLEGGAILRALGQRADWSRRYDPIRLTVQHDAFGREHIEEAMARHAAVDVMQPDITLTDVVN